MKIPTVEDLINIYDAIIKGIDKEALNSKDRAYGGIIRAGKGSLVENIAKGMIQIAWDRLNGDQTHLSLNKKKVRIPIKVDYVKRIKNPEIKSYIQDHFGNYYYELNIDVPVYIDNELVLGVECKSYTENAMLKRILVDFTLLKTQYPTLDCVLLQLESQLNGDYSNISQSIIFGSSSTHTLLSYFDVDLYIITLLQGERKVKKPIHKKEYFKELTSESIEKAISTFQNILSKYKK